MRAYAEQTWGSWAPAGNPAQHVAAFDPSGQSLIVIDDEPIGITAVREHGSEVVIEKLYLLTPHRSAGIGSRILRSVLAMARARSKPVRLHTLAVNVRARAFYLRHGFVVEREDHERVYFVKRNT
ncbi:MAG TPA: GNAT family N-acetyltransferase [Burkholderiaceae bacterium]|nr:GNAT family N-acetyltransferase [Burkholderiaceae bacterium]